jgi:hypothetical protein
VGGGQEGRNALPGLRNGLAGPNPAAQEQINRWAAFRLWGLGAYLLVHSHFTICYTGQV